MSNVSRAVASLTLISLLSACAASFKGYEGEDLKEEQLAVVDNGDWAAPWSSICMHCVYEVVREPESGGGRIVYESSRDGVRAKVLLKPGRYAISSIHFQHVFYRDVLALQAGHVYRIHSNACLSCYASDGHWIEDLTTGEVVAGTKH